MELVEKIKGLLLSGKSEDEVLVDVVNDGTEDEVVEALEKAKKIVNVKNLTVTKAKEAEEKKAFELKVKEAVDAQLKEIKVDNFKSDAKVVSNPNSWKSLTRDMLKAMVDNDKSELGRLSAHAKSEAEFAGKAVTGDVNANGGYFMPYQMDDEIDKVLYDQSELLNAITIRNGSYRTLINGVGPVTVDFRADQSTAFSATQPTFTQQEVDYKEVGAIVPVSFSAIEDSAYDLVGEITSQFGSAMVDKLEPLVCTGRITTSADAFNGIWFTSSIGSVDAINKDSATAAIKNLITTQDMFNLVNAINYKTRRNATFVLSTAEVMALMSEQTTTGAYKDQVRMVNGQWIHVPTGKRIIVVDSNVETLTASDKTGGLYRFAGLFDLSRFRMYADGSYRVATSSEIYFDKNQLAIRVFRKYKHAIPTNSLNSFVRLVGVGKLA